MHEGSAEEQVKRKSIRTTTVHSESEKFPRKCFFGYSDESNKQTLHSVTTFGVDRGVRKIATEMNDSVILAKLTQGDMIAIEACYNAKCSSSYYNKSCAKERESKCNSDAVLYGVSLAEIVAQIEEQKDEAKTTVFKLADLIKMYYNRIEELGHDLEGRIHSTHFKDRLLSSCPNLVEYESGRDIFVSFREGTGAILQNAYAEDEGTYLAKAANIVRREILNCSVRFEGTFHESSQKVSVPKTLVTLLGMIMNGSNLTLKINHENVYKQQPCLLISQLLVYNTYKRRRQLGEQNFSRHNKGREPPLPVYVGLLIHSQTQQSNLVSNLHDLVISISYDGVLEIENEATYAMCEQYKTEGVL